MDDLANQLASVIRDGLRSNPYARQSLLAALEQEQATKSEANYREADSDERCGTCDHYTPDDASAGHCSVVAGPVNPEYVSDLYEPSRTTDPGSGDSEPRRGSRVGSVES